MTETFIFYHINRLQTTDKGGVVICGTTKIHGPTVTGLMQVWNGRSSEFNSWGAGEIGFFRKCDIIWAIVEVEIAYIISLVEGEPMEQMGYGEHIAGMVREMPYDAAIQTDHVAQRLAEEFTLPYHQAKELTNVKLKRMADKDEIRRLQKGVYCQVKQTVFRRTTPDVDAVMAKTLLGQGGGRIGYESGASLLNKLGLTTLLPRDIEITTNRVGSKLPEGCHIRLKKPPATVTDGNWKYLQFIDLIAELPRAHIDAPHPEKMMMEYAKKQQLDSLALIFTARQHYPVKTVLGLIDLFMEVENETASR